jgi:hypothetical protein
MCLFKEFFMKRKKLARMVVLAFVFSLMLVGCDECKEPDDTIIEIPAVYKDFYNYPTGREDNAALLTVENSYNSPVLLFHTDFSAETYIGTVGSLNSIKVRLPDEKFYTIVAVDKADFEERRFQASQFSNLTYYSRTQAFDVKVNSGLTSGNKQWVLNNNTKYWCKVVSVSNPATVFAVLAPGTIRVTLPLNTGDYYDYEPVFMQALKYQGRVIAMSEFADRASGDTTYVDDDSPVYTSSFPVTLTFTDLKPNVELINNSGRTLRIYKTKTRQMTNGAVGSDWSLGSGSKALVTGFDVGDNTEDIYFWAVPWTANNQDGFKKVTENEVMQRNKIYRITVGSEANTITVEVKDVSEVLEN